MKHLTKRPHINDLLKSLSSKGYRLAVLSDFGEVELRLKALGIDTTLFEQMLSSENLGGFKPNPLPFEKSLEILNLPADQVLMVGDRDDTDREGAEKMGMPFLQVPGKTNEGWNEAVKPLWEIVRV